MILDISDPVFCRIFNSKRFYLPMRWDGEDFLETVKELYTAYLGRIKRKIFDRDFIESIKKICDTLEEAIRYYLDGFPAKAFDSINSAMTLLLRDPLRIYQKSSSYIYEYDDDELNLFRVTTVEENIPQKRSRVFHTPYNMRSKVSTSRYSIAGYPSLYLGTNLDLCCNEIHYRSDCKNGLAAKYKFERNIGRSEISIEVIEMAVKPQDFFYEINSEHKSLNKSYTGIDLNEGRVKRNYLLWYPLIAASSFIRAKRKDPFAAEYIIPQLIMQWIRDRMDSKECGIATHLVGIRYFSCASVRASNMGYNYVFPASGQKISKKFQYCPILKNAFVMTVPYYLCEYDSIKDCELAMIKDNRLKTVDR